ncbi:uncharacterized protein EI90DRAFT_3153499 [Cantharellus anzutake]|uniref:uncharacterized protein n=1 Tax=Cantharellus anzutake TaxID=1750568 RepID=UPI00190802C5|nr:uncharacterized protein EI90DRAFT_3153499 [Cantharellus anzutake]KAF8334163.1 hypothetical protein EI90DRAFT_3153499 [Cantharellus anzutake]
MHPLPQSLPKECHKAERIMRGFIEPSRNGLDGVVPRHVLSQALGFVIFTVIKAGFLFSARGGSGVVIARLADGTWSAPSAIGTAGMGFGGQAGAGFAHLSFFSGTTHSCHSLTATHEEITEFLIVLNSRSALQSFMAAGSLTLGGNLSVAVGPLGRNGELSGSVNTKGKVAAMYSYSKTKGLFGGISLEGSVILERQDANCKAYNDHRVSAKMLLSGQVPPPPWAMGLIDTLEKSTGSVKGWIQEEVTPESNLNSYAFGSGIQSPPSQSRSSSESKTKSQVEKENGKSVGGVSQKNSTDSFFSSRKLKKFRGGFKSTEDEWDSDLREHYRSTSPLADSPFRSTPTVGFGADDLAARDDPLLFTSIPSKPSITAKQARDSTSQFETHFESDFDPFRDVGETTQPAHRRNTQSLSSSSTNNDANVPTGQGSGHSYTEPSFSLYDHPTLHKVMTGGYTGFGSNTFRTSVDAEPPRYSDETRTPPLTTSIDSSDTSSPSPVSQRASTPSHNLSFKRGLNSHERDDGLERAVALFDYNAQEDGDLSFKKGDVITIVKRTGSTDDWWTGSFIHTRGSLACLPLDAFWAPAISIFEICPLQYPDRSYPSATSMYRISTILFL